VRAGLRHGLSPRGNAGHACKRARLLRARHAALRAQASKCWTGLGSTLPAYKPAVAGLRELAPVVHEEAA
jgi:hypothetical protein